MQALQKDIIAILSEMQTKQGCVTKDKKEMGEILVKHF